MSQPVKSKVDVLVIGAGPSGSISAAIMQQHGLDVMIVEKLRFPRFVIGESLLPRCMEALEEAGMLDAVKAKGFQQKNGAKFVMDGQVCDFNFSWQFTPGWSWTWQVPRAEFDKTLADECERRDVPVHYETEVIAVQIHDDESSTTTLRLPDGTEHTVEARFIVDGSGYGRVLPTLFGMNKPSTQYTRKAMFCHLQDTLRHTAVEPDRITIYVHNPTTWIWVIPFSSGVTSVGYVGSPDFFDAYEGTPEEIFRALIAAEPALAERFGESEMLWEPRILQSWSASSTEFFGKGFVLTGNVTEFLDPVFSSGVTLASVSAQTAANLVVRHLRGEQVDWLNDFQRHMEKGVAVFRTFVNGWYDGTLFKIFFAENPDQQVLSQMCSVLAGYVWDDNNPVVRNPDKTVQRLASFLSMRAGSSVAG